jgi:hypothetical protein
MYIKIIDGQPQRYSLSQLRADNPNTSFPATPTVTTLAEYGVYPCVDDPAPTADVVERGGFYQVGDVWHYGWISRPYTDAEKRSAMVITPRQARLALSSVGKLSAVADAIAVTPEPNKTMIAIEWEYATVVERTSPWVEALRPALGMTEQELDNLFVSAANL